MLEYGKSFLVCGRGAGGKSRGSLAVRMRTGAVGQAGGDVDKADGDIAEVAAASVGIFYGKNNKTQ